MPRPVHLSGGTPRPENFLLSVWEGELRARPDQVWSGAVVPKVISFKEALTLTASARKRHLLLGNGFSIALQPDIFSYGSLLTMLTSALLRTCRTCLRR